MQYQLSKKQKGMSLLEVLISMLIIGMGLGMSVSMIQASNRYAEEAENRAIAINELQSIVSSMKSNVLGGPQYVWGERNYKGDDYAVGDIPNNDKPSCKFNCDLVEKSQEEAFAQARADLLAWLTNLNRVLPGGQAAIEQSNGLYTVTVMWADQDVGANDDENSNDTAKNNGGNTAGSSQEENSDSAGSSDTDEDKSANTEYDTVDGAKSVSLTFPL